LLKLGLGLGQRHRVSKVVGIKIYWRSTSALILGKWIQGLILRVSMLLKVHLILRVSTLLKVHASHEKANTIL
jgi:hypothetical protein